MNRAEVVPNALKEASEAATSRDYTRAETLLLELLDVEPENVQALDLLGFVLFFQGRVVEAEAVCHQALTIEPQRPYSLSGLGLCLARQGRIGEGVQSLRDAIRLAPNWFDPRWDLALVLVDAQRWDEADEVLREAEIAIPAQQSRFAHLRRSIDQRRRQAR